MFVVANPPLPPATSSMSESQMLDETGPAPRMPSSISVASRSVHPYSSAAQTPRHRRRQQPSSSPSQHQPQSNNAPSSTEEWFASSAQSSSSSRPRETLYSPTLVHQHQPPLSADSLSLLPPPNALYSDFDQIQLAAESTSNALEREHEHKQHQSSSGPSRPVSAADSSNPIPGSSASLNPQELSSASIPADDALHPERPTSNSPQPRPPRSRPPKASRAKRQPTSGSADSSSPMATRYSSTGPREPGGRSSQPKSSRKQFSACGACQLRQLSDRLSFFHRPFPRHFRSLCPISSRFRDYSLMLGYHSP